MDDNGPKVQKSCNQEQRAGVGRDDLPGVKARPGTQTLPKSFCFEIPQENMIQIKMRNRERESGVFVSKVCRTQVPQSR